MTKDIYHDVSAEPIEFVPPKSAGEWENRRQEIRSVLNELLGDLPPRPVVPPVNITSKESRVGFTLEKFSFHNGADAEVTGCILIPEGLKEPAPAVQYNHFHGGEYSLGKDEIFRAGWPVEGTIAENLVREGYVVIATDSYMFGDRSGKGPGGPEERGGSEESSLFKTNLWRGRTLWGMMVRDDRMTLDYLLSRPEVDADRVGAMGMSMGSTRTWWLAALDDRIKTAVAVSCLTRCQSLIASGKLSAHGIYFFVPNLLKHFDAESVIACIAPRALLTLTGDQDFGSPIEGVEYVNASVRQVYDVLGATSAFRSVVYQGVGHEFTGEMWRESIEWLRKGLAS